MESIFDFSSLPPLPVEVRELLLIGLPFIAIAFVTAAVMFLARDLLGKPKPNGRNGNRRTQRPGANGNGNGHKSTGNGNGRFALSSDMAIPTLAQPTASEGTGIGDRMENWFSRLLYESGAPFARDVAFMTEMAGGLVVGGILFLWLDNLAVAAVGGILGMGAVVGLYMLARSRRQRIMREQLPDLIEHLARAVRAGQTIDQAIHLVGETSPEPLGLEFRRCSGQLDMGLSVDAAVRSLSRRVPVPEMRILASTFIVQRRAGGSLPTTLERLAKVIRDRISFFRQFRAATAGSRMSMIIVSLTAPLVAIYMMVWQPEFFGHFFESTMGWIFFFTAITLYVLGLAWIYKLLRVEY